MSFISAVVRFSRDKEISIWSGEASTHRMWFLTNHSTITINVSCNLLGFSLLLVPEIYIKLDKTA